MLQCNENRLHGKEFSVDKDTTLTVSFRRLDEKLHSEHVRFPEFALPRDFAHDAIANAHD